MRIRPVEGAPRFGGSSFQSLARGAGSIETDYLNGEIVLLGRMHGLPCPRTPASSLAARMVREGIEPGSLLAAGDRGRPRRGRCRGLRGGEALSVCGAFRFRRESTMVAR